MIIIIVYFSKVGLFRGIKQYRHVVDNTRLVDVPVAKIFKKTTLIIMDFTISINK